MARPESRGAARYGRAEPRPTLSDKQHSRLDAPFPSGNVDVEATWPLLQGILRA